MITCFVRSLKEKIYTAKSNGASLLGILAIIFGFGAIQAGTIGAPICGASIGAGVIAIAYPNLAMNFFEDYSVTIILVSILIQIIALYLMKCFKLKK